MKRSTKTNSLHQEALLRRDPRQHRHVWNAVPVHVDASNGHRRPEIHRRSIQHGCTMANLKLLQHVWNAVPVHEDACNDHRRRCNLKRGRRLDVLKTWYRCCHDWWRCRRHDAAGLEQGVVHRRHGHRGHALCESYHWCRSQKGAGAAPTVGRHEEYDSAGAGATTALGVATTAAGAAEKNGGMVPGVVYAREARVAKDIAKERRELLHRRQAPNCLCEIVRNVHPSRLAPLPRAYAATRHPQKDHGRTESGMRATHVGIQTASVQLTLERWLHVKMQRLRQRHVICEVRRKLYECRVQHGHGQHLHPVRSSTKILRRKPMSTFGPTFLRLHQPFPTQVTGRTVETSERAQVGQVQECTDGQSETSSQNAKAGHERTVHCQQKRGDFEKMDTRSLTNTIITRAVSRSLLW